MSNLEQEWKKLLTDYNGFVLGSAQLEVPAEVREAGWCGRPPASEAEIRKVEARLRAPLPPSYREFLRVTNGWSVFDDFIFRLLSADQIDWFRTLQPDRARAILNNWERRGNPPIPDDEYFDYTNSETGAYRAEYLPNCLVLGEGYDAELLLLNPTVIAPDGEWEALYFANWIPGAYRYRSFIELCRSAFNVTKIISP